MSVDGLHCVTKCEEGTGKVKGMAKRPPRIGEWPRGSTSNICLAEALQVEALQAAMASCSFDHDLDPRFWLCGLPTCALRSQRLQLALGCDSCLPSSSSTLALGDEVWSVLAAFAESDSLARGIPPGLL